MNDELEVSVNTLTSIEMQVDAALGVSAGMLARSKSQLTKARRELCCGYGGSYRAAKADFDRLLCRDTALLEIKEKIVRAKHIWDRSASY